jgi:hypothetical protein
MSAADEPMASGSHPAALNDTDAMLAPRTLASKRPNKRAKKTKDPVLETLTAAPTDDVPIHVASDLLPESTLEFVALELEAALSNYGLSKSPSLLAAVTAGDGHVQLQEVLKHPLLGLDITVDQALQALQARPSSKLEARRCTVTSYRAHFCRWMRTRRPSE